MLIIGILADGSQTILCRAPQGFHVEAWSQTRIASLTLLAIVRLHIIE